MFFYSFVLFLQVGAYGGQSEMKNGRQNQDQNWFCSYVLCKAGWGKKCYNLKKKITHKNGYSVH